VAAVAVALDEHFDFQVHDQRLLVGDAGTALTLTSVVATGMLAFLGIVFATTLVAIQLAASQYSPRAVRVFIRSRLTKVCLGIFVATFVFSIVTLIAIRSAGRNDAAFTPVLSTSCVELLVLATLVAFLLFANGTTRLLRVQYLVERIASDTQPALHLAFGDHDVVECARPEPAPPAVEVISVSHGVLDAIDVAALLLLAEQLDGWLEITAPIGSYIARSTPIGTVRPGPGTTLPADADQLARRVSECLLFSNERTLLQDPGFGFRQLVDIAIRALSPAVNDPTTATQVVDRLADLLGQIPDRPDPSGWFAGESGVARVRIPRDGFDELMTLAFAEIIRYGADSPQVTRRVSAALGSLEARARLIPRAGISEMRDLLAAATEENSPRAFLALAASPDPRGLG
jgi:uncharacterized membrane protein